MSLNWTNIPSHIFVNIFSHFKSDDLKVLSLVCRSWYEEIGDCWSEKFALKCCSVDTLDQIDILKQSCRQYRSFSICNSHIDISKDIISTIHARKLRKQSKIESIAVDGVFYTANVSFEKVVDLLNEHGQNLKILKLSGLKDERTNESCDLDLKMLPNVRHFELKGLLELSQKSLDSLCGAFKNLKTLKLNLNRLKSFHQKFHIIQNFLLKNSETLEDLNVEFEIENMQADVYLESLKLLTRLKNCWITFSDRNHKTLSLDVLKFNSNLEALRLKGCYISNEDMIRIPRYFSHLQDIRLYLDGNISEPSLRAIGELSNIKSIDLLFDSKYPDWFENWFNYCNKNITSLKLLGCRRFYDFFVSKSLKDRIEFAKSNPLNIDNILRNFTQLEYLTVKLTAVNMENSENLAFSNLKCAIFEDCNSQESTHRLFQKFCSPTLVTLKTDMLGMEDDTVEVVLNNFPSLKNLFLYSEDKLSIKAMESLTRAKLEMVSCYNLSFDMGMELLKNSKFLRSAELKFNVPQMDVHQRLKFENEHKDIILTTNSFDHKVAHEFLMDICKAFDPPLQKSANQGWVVGSQCYRTYNLNRTGVNVDIAIKFNSFLDN